MSQKDKQPDLSPEQSWLYDFLKKVDQERWCNKLYCTTCSSDNFRQELFLQGAKRAGINSAAYANERKSLESLNPEDFESVRRVIIEGLRSMPSEAAGLLNQRNLFMSLGMIFYFLNIWSPDGVAWVSQPEELKGTWTDFFFKKISVEIAEHNERRRVHEQRNNSQHMAAAQAAKQQRQLVHQRRLAETKSPGYSERREARRQERLKKYLEKKNSQGLAATASNQGTELPAPAKQLNAWEQQAEAFKQRIQSSGFTVTETAQPLTTQLQARFVPRRPAQTAPKEPGKEDGEAGGGKKE